MSWTQSDKDLLRTMWAQGSSSGQIAAALSSDVSRNAVMGMVNRLGLMGLGNADVPRAAAMDRVSDLLGEEFSLGTPLHREAFLTFIVHGSKERTPAGLALRSGVSSDQCAAFLERLAVVWPMRTAMPLRWQGGLEGNLAFILDMAVVAGSLRRVPERPSPGSQPQPQAGGPASLAARRKIQLSPVLATSSMA